MFLEKMRLWRFVFIRCFLISFVGICASYFALKAIFGQSPIGPPFYAFYRILAYWDEYPLQYIGLVCLCYALLSASWTTFCGQSKSWSRVLQISGVVLASFFASCYACGLLWSFHDMQAGYFPSRFIAKMLEDGENGLRLGPLMINNSFPLNLIALTLGYFTTSKTTRNGLMKWCAPTITGDAPFNSSRD